ncbi:thioredoxin family protein [Marininema halotolerans]|uniref:AhpC/TSA family protein n=1 Tax=Marininema halotolerans TaxID=1155944 RepID=A0A1I6RK23_9BACL|nr:thioredoxin family protein [Marininema halotolerans]SFS65042.1 AhpC/TSA family protein [Marininema halotolerans]
MARTESTMLALGSEAPFFSLVDVVTGKIVSRESIGSAQAQVIMFICNHCPFVIHVQEQLVQLAKDYQQKGINFIAINSNDAKAYPEDSPDRMKEVAQEMGYPFPYLFDETQEVARAFQAACTPDFFIFNEEWKLVYRGQLDDSRPGNDKPVTGESIRAALDHQLAGTPIPTQQKPSLGCNIKWKDNNSK